MIYSGAHEAKRGKRKGGGRAMVACMPCVRIVLRNVSRGARGALASPITTQ